MMKFFNLDLHISVIADIKDIFKSISDIEIINWSCSSHSWVFNERPNTVNIINGKTWESIDLTMVSKFQAEYDSFLSEFDGFIVGHPNVFTFLYEKYNKPVLVVNSCRYDMPFCFNGNMSMIKELNDCFRRLQQNNLLYFVSNNKADNAYFRMANPDIHTRIIPSLCLYTNMRWDPNAFHEKFLLYSGNIPIPHPSIISRNAIGRFTWESLMNFRGIIHLPYEASTMSMFEHISSGIPLFFPSKAFLKDLWQSRRAHFQCNYWKDIGKKAVPSYLEETNHYDFWIHRADIYDLCGVYYFDSFEDLHQQIHTFKDTLYDIRTQYIQQRKEKACTDWKTILDSLPTPTQTTTTISGQEFIFTKDDIIYSDKFLQLENESIAYMKTDLLKARAHSIMWRGKHHILRPAKIWITGHSDFSIDASLFQIYKHSCKQWYCSNKDVDEKQLQSLPLGITNCTNESSLHPIYGNIDIMIETMGAPRKIVNLAYMNFNIGTYRVERAPCFEYFKDMPWVTKGVNDVTLEGRKQFLEECRNHTFVICPRGNGIDTHRLWETLYMGSIPIVKKHIHLSEFSDLPILFVDDWNEVTEDFLQKKYNEMKSKTYTMEKLTFGYWKKRILFSASC